MHEVIGSIPTVSTIVEPVEPKGLAGFPLCSTACRDVGSVDDMPVSDRYSFPKRQTEIPTDLFSEVVGIIIFRIFVEDLDLVIEQDDLIYESVDQQLRFRFQRIHQERLYVLLGEQIGLFTFLGQNSPIQLIDLQFQLGDSVFGGGGKDTGFQRFHEIIQSLLRLASLVP